MLHFVVSSSFAIVEVGRGCQIDANQIKYKNISLRLYKKRENRLDCRSAKVNI